MDKARQCCEGEKTEPNYFKAFRDDLPKGVVQVEIYGVGMNTLSLIEEAKRIKKRLEMQDRTVDKVWVVFDRDSFAADNFDNAIAKAASQRFGAAWSNEAFELWYLLHFQPRTTPMCRTEFQKELSTCLGRTYAKNDSGMYDNLKDKMSVARGNADKLVAWHKNTAPHKANPCTHVQELVAALEQLREEQR